MCGPPGEGTGLPVRVSLTHDSEQVGDGTRIFDIGLRSRVAVQQGPGITLVTRFQQSVE